MKIVLFGSHGQVGWELQRALAPLGEVIALTSSSTAHCGDLKNPVGIRQTLHALRPRIIVNAAAYTAVDRAESEPELAQAINGEAPGTLARLAAEMGAWLVHYSTDYVFDGTGDAPRLETDPTAPLNVYGRSKLAGELQIAASGCQHLIFRTSWVYAARGNNFVKTMLRLAGEREALSVVADQHGAPTGAELIADTTAHALRQALSRPELVGLYHLTAAGATDWHSYACRVIHQARQHGMAMRVRGIRPIPTDEFPTPARRPANSRLATGKLSETFDVAMPPWETGVDRVLAEILNH